MATYNEIGYLYQDLDYVSRLLFSNLVGITINGLPEKYSIGDKAFVSATGHSSMYNVISDTDIGLNVLAKQQSVTSVIDGETFSIAYAGRLSLACRQTTISSSGWPTENDGYITLTLHRSRGFWMVVPQQSPQTAENESVYEGGTIVSSPTLTLTGGYLYIRTTAFHGRFMLLPMVENPQITFDPNGGSIAEQDRTRYVPADVQKPVGQLPTATRLGYSLDGWYTEQTGGARVESDTIVTGENDRTYFAHWIRDAEVTFDPNGGYLTPSERTRYVPVGSALGALPTPNRTGYAFLGWFTAASGGTQVTESTVITQDSDVTYYAHWSKSNVYALLDATGGVCSPAILELTVGGTYSGLTTPTRPKFSFDGWYTAATGGAQVTSATTVTDTENHTLYAHWTADPPPQGDRDLIYDDATGRLIYDDRPVPELH